MFMAWVSSTSMRFLMMIVLMNCANMAVVSSTAARARTEDARSKIV